MALVQTLVTICQVLNLQVPRLSRRLKVSREALVRDEGVAVHRQDVRVLVTNPGNLSKRKQFRIRKNIAGLFCEKGYNMAYNELQYRETIWFTLNCNMKGKRITNMLV